MGSLCRFPTKSVLAPKYPSTPPRENTGTLLETAAGVNGGLDWNDLINASAEWQSMCGSFSETPVTCSALKWKYIPQKLEWHHILLQLVIILPFFYGAAGKLGPRTNSLLCGCTWGCALPPVNGPVTLMWVSVCCSFWILSWTLLASLDKQLPPLCESSSEPRTRAASLTSPDWSSTWKHTFVNSCF